MLADRLKTVIVLLPIGVALMAAGGWLFWLTVALVLGLAAREYGQLFQKGGYQPPLRLLITGSALLPLIRGLYGMEATEMLLGGLIVLAMAHAVFAARDGARNAAVDFNITIGGLLYVGWLGSYLVSIRELPDGFWWLMASLPITWIADGGAYFIGRSFGRTRMAPHISPNKTWEGYAGGVFFGSLGGAALAWVLHQNAAAVLPVHGLMMGIVISVLTPLGDLGESLLKRQFNVKDSSNLLPGHGGALDRIDTWLWAGPLSYFLIYFIFLR